MILSENVPGKECSMPITNVMIFRFHETGPNTLSRSRRNDIFYQGIVVRRRKLGDFAIAFVFLTWDRMLSQYV